MLSRHAMNVCPSASIDCGGCFTLSPHETTAAQRTTTHSVQRVMRVLSEPVSHAAKRTSLTGRPARLPLLSHPPSEQVEDRLHCISISVATDQLVLQPPAS